MTTETLSPSDVVRSASDELGDTLAAVRVQALEASGASRTELLELFKKLLKRQQKFMLRNLKLIDKDPEIVAQVDALSVLAQQIAKARREMTTTKKAIDNATRVLGFVDTILGILGKVGLL